MWQVNEKIIENSGHTLSGLMNQDAAEGTEDSVANFTSLVKSRG